MHHLWILDKNTILKAIHNPVEMQPQGNYLWILDKNTILKAIHNSNVISVLSQVPVNPR